MGGVYSPSSSVNDVVLCLCVCVVLVRVNHLQQCCFNGDNHNTVGKSFRTVLNTAFVYVVGLHETDGESDRDGCCPDKTVCGQIVSV